MKLLQRLFLLFLFICVTTVALAQTSAELRRNKEAIQREIDLLQRNLNETSSTKRLTMGQIRAINSKIRLMQNKISIINSEVKNLDNQIHENTNEVHSLKSQLGQLKNEYAGMVRFAQRNRNAYEKMMFIFASDNFNQAYKRIKYFQQFGQYRKKQADYIQGTQKKIEYKIVVLDKNLKEKSNLLTEQQQEKVKLGKNKTEQAQMLNQISRQEKQFRQDIAARKRKQAEIDRAIRSAIQREIELARKKAEEEERLAAQKAIAEGRPVPVAKEKTNSSYLTASPESAKLSAGFENNRGRLPWPVGQYSIVERFGNHTEGQANYTNDGINILTEQGAAVKAVFEGEVLFVRELYGTYIVALRHGDYFTIYQNLKTVSVAKGNKVETKQTLGVVASKEDGPVLHFEIMRGQTKLNPEAWIAK
ncbi:MULTISPECIES: murein hydrolase activator EnvC family protein [Pedobacter]|uniref:Peptidase M23 n=1 Tax=Pedobacter heparinus (strain ATCC 13125 / DSM 2366 / CIP 104194 / JCM 7457 / NBRC 12017 / NCIMB 9290 / NRRL B-14731 / HIM 762-3) TaxID=485917 RepID=C6XYT3_PEDHD|nr:MULTISPECIES: peptidoglycan DD-metalloendopeptidase family protein [Pedobacter]ACU04565.1 Peptidase M23 [Pedobacter heparinus DSM 2366]MBB5437586.1 septal ring factor EnvC (AmiA/AmiB activator) [Pedobacter sp. AK017]